METDDEIPVLQLDRVLFQRYLQESQLTITEVCRRGRINRSTLTYHLSGEPKVAGPKLIAALRKIFPFPGLFRPLEDRQMAS